MPIEERILQLLKRIGVPALLVFCVVAVVIVYQNYLHIKLTELEIKQAERELGLNA
jgi:hypothetical protein